ncbi:hypothetical protein ABFA07_002414 [Porites harrisoni]
MTDKGSDSEQVPAAANAVDSSPPAYPSELPPPYIQQPGYQAPPSYEVPPGYQGPPAYQTLPGYPSGQVYQGVPVGYVVATDIPPDYQGLSWFSCLCCCWPLGIVAILKSNEVKSSLSRGDFHSARIASNSARNFAYAAIGIGVGFLVMYIIAMVLVFTIVASSN